MIATQVMIRCIEREDLPEMLRMCEAHAAYEQLPFHLTDQLCRLEEDLFSDRPKLYGLVAADEELLGYSTYMLQYSTWEAREYLYMDCLFVKEEARSRGIGRQLLEQVTSEARRLGCTEVQWHTPAFNTRAMQFYAWQGAYSKSKERFFLNTKNDTP